MARAPVFYEFGDPADVLKIEDLPQLEPATGEVRINVNAFALNRADLLFIHGEHYSLPKFPSRLGDECSGTIDAIGEDVSGFKIGDRVSTIPFHNEKYKTHGESTLVPARFVAHFPDHLTFEEGTSIWMQYLTAYFAAIEICRLTSEDYVLIAAASSSAALGCMQLAKAIGATAIGSTRTSEKKQKLLDLGYDHVVAYQEEKLGQRVADISAGQGARMIYDPIGGTFAREYYDGLAQDATIVYYGMLSALSMEVDILPMVRTASIVHPYSMYNHVVIPEQLERGKEFIYENLDSGKLKPVIGRVFGFGEIVDSYRYMESNTQIGKIVVRVA
jgi:NADPH:quinone reductase-like Zn-dependent oxidoreductase